MKLPAPVSASFLAKFLNAEYHGPEDLEITGINEIHKVESGDLTFADHPKFHSRALNSPADLVLLDQSATPPQDQAVLISANPFDDFNRLLKHFAPYAAVEKPIADDLEVGKGSIIEPGVIIAGKVRIGENCLIHAGVILYDNVIIGDGVEIHSGAIIGGHAFYYKTISAVGLRTYTKLHSSGRVVIGDEVEIGANTTIDKGATGDTIIGKGTKIDNLVHIGHGVEIGEYCLFAAQCGVGGKAIIGDRCVFWGQVGISKDLTIGDDTTIYAQSGVKDSIPGGKVWFGSPVREAREKMRELAASKDLYEMWKKWER
jgi:UDP-3-O-[3-hydroxymyristoyl] glucosamine N-acyltransferase